MCSFPWSWPGLVGGQPLTSPLRWKNESEYWESPVRSASNSSISWITSCNSAATTQTTPSVRATGLPVQRHPGTSPLMRVLVPDGLCKTAGFYPLGSSLKKALLASNPSLGASFCFGAWRLARCLERLLLVILLCCFHFQNFWLVVVLSNFSIMKFKKL